MHKLKNFWKDDNWKALLGTYGAQSTATMTVTDDNTDDFDMITFDMYFTGTNSATAKKTIPCTVCTKTYVDTNAMAYTGTLTGSSYTQTINYPPLTLTVQDSSADVSMSFDSTLGSSLSATSTTVGVISSYQQNAMTPNQYASGTWVGYTNSVYANTDNKAEAWLGLAVDRTSSTTSGQNVLWNMNALGNMDSMIWNMPLSIGGTSTFNVGTAAYTNYFDSDNTSTFRHNIDGFMVTTQPSIDVLRTSYILPSLPATIDTSSFATYVPNTYWDFIMKEMLDRSIGFFWDTELQTAVVSCDQYAIMANMYVKFEAQSGYTGNSLWYTITPTDYMTEIDQTDQCQVQFIQNSSDEWILGLAFLNNYTTDFKINSSSNSQFAINDVSGNKPWTSTETGVLEVVVNEGVSLQKVLIQTGLTAILGGQMYLQWFQSEPEPEPEPVPEPKAEVYNPVIELAICQTCLDFINQIRGTAEDCETCVTTMREDPDTDFDLSAVSCRDCKNKGGYDNCSSCVLSVNEQYVPEEDENLEENAAEASL